MAKETKETGNLVIMYHTKANKEAKRPALRGEIADLAGLDRFVRESGAYWYQFMIGGKRLQGNIFTVEERTAGDVKITKF